ncbi:MAG: hypothetical protein ACRC4N_06205 [Gammaproteobacteria bacterium]
MEERRAFANTAKGNETRLKRMYGSERHRRRLITCQMERVVVVVRVVEVEGEGEEGDWGRLFVAQTFLSLNDRRFEIDVDAKVHLLSN